jgi:hypothetical protein
MCTENVSVRETVIEAFVLNLLGKGCKIILNFKKEG